jgi:hypothetical protein
MFSEQRLSRVSVRSTLLAALRRIVGVVRASAQPGAPPLDEWLDPARRGRSRRITRRRLLRDAAIAGVTLGLPRSLASYTVE